MSAPTASPTPSPTPPPAAPEPDPPRSFTVLGAGDILLHDAFWYQAQREAAGTGYDFNPVFTSIRPAVSGADLAICHMETPVGPENGPFSNFPIFSVPPQIAPALAQTGYDTCSTASNHSLDGGEAGVVRTLNALDAAGIKHAGTARSAEEHLGITMLVTHGVVVAHLSYTFSFNGLVRPTGKEWIANYLDIPDVLAEARLAKIAGAGVVIVSIHAGSEYQHSANAQQIGFANELLSSPDIDLILGAHVHVVQPMERIGDKWIAYGMGNQVAWQNFDQVTRDGVMPRFTFTEVSPGVFRVTKAEALATYMWLDGGPARVYDIAAALAAPETSAGVRAGCLASLRRTQQVLAERGAFGAGLELAGVNYLA
jgi:poly-gamma-glutamate synthesis protein (capsule biosynthesis protein)